MPWLVWGFCLPTVTLAHSTFAINTVNHMFGSRRFDTIDESRNNPLTALFAVGEGWHNNHHRYQRAARNGFYWWEFDPTWYVIRAMQAVGLAWDVQPVPARIYAEAAGHARATRQQRASASSRTSGRSASNSPKRPTDVTDGGSKTRRTLERRLDRDELSGVPRAADRDDQILRAVHHVGHRTPALRRRDVHGANLLAGRLVERAQHRAALAVRRRAEVALAGDHQRLGHQRAAVVAGPSRAAAGSDPSAPGCS